MDKIKDFFRKIMVGRYGIDKMGEILLFISLALNIMLMFVRNPGVRSILSTITMILLFVVTFRMMSRNINARYQENIKFMKITKPLRAEFEIMKMRWRDKKEFRYVRCDNCKNVMRVPKGAGKIRIKCRKCGNEFIKRV